MARWRPADLTDGVAGDTRATHGEPANDQPPHGSGGGDGHEQGSPGQGEILDEGHQQEA